MIFFYSFINFYTEIIFVNFLGPVRLKQGQVQLCGQPRLLPLDTGPPNRHHGRDNQADTGPLPQVRLHHHQHRVGPIDQEDGVPADRVHTHLHCQRRQPVVVGECEKLVCCFK